MISDEERRRRKGKGNLEDLTEVLLELGVEGGAGVWASDNGGRDMSVRGVGTLKIQRSEVEHRTWGTEEAKRVERRVKR